jgi:hypothetical protein
LGDVLGAVYAYVDKTGTPTTPYVYWLEDISFQGVKTLHEPVTIAAAPQAVLRQPVFLPLRVKTP